jgi:phosphoribosylglycinamide formyltransferase-1
MTARVAILLSGRGSNFLALHGAMERGEVPARIERVISNVPDSAGLARAQDLRIPSLCYPHRLEPSREAHEAKILNALREAEIEWICLAGYMRKLSESFVSQYPQRILNIHPSLLPAFPGLEPQRQALEHGVKVTGCTVHLVDEEVDHGPVLFQSAVPVEAGDDEDRLHERIKAEEHRLLPVAARLVAEGRVRVEGRRARVVQPEEVPR